MNVVRSIAIALSCFSSIPMPQVQWDEANMRYMMAAFPLVGVIIGALVWLWSWACGALGFHTVLYAGGLTLIPLIVSGGIHMDGFADVIDAQTSHAEPARKREILRDPHTGAFAIIGVGCYLLAYFAFASEVAPGHVFALACVPVISRTLSGFATVTFAAPSDEGMFSAERSTPKAGVVRTVLVVLFVCVIALLAWQDAVVGIVMVVVAVVVLGCVKVFADSQFGGMNGDIAGFFLQVAELAMLITIVVVAAFLPGA
ncbi:MAG: adenosylcobinamide-GDP ribazoletransferase [Eggerthellaceae bacterium]|nr:adenosylcobinamide-GDP ribazoletransferase [Eggerthellaceae bacterium]